MNTSVEQTASRFDSVKLLLALGVLVAGVGGFYYFSGHSHLLRVLGLLALAGVAVAIASNTEAGRGLWQFAKGSRNEVRKVVWPSRAETIQTTLMVFVMVVIVAIFLWMLDMLLAWAVRLLTGQGG